MQTAEQNEDTLKHVLVTNHELLVGGLSCSSDMAS